MLAIHKLAIEILIIYDMGFEDLNCASSYEFGEDMINCLLYFPYWRHCAAVVINQPWSHICWYNWSGCTDSKLPAKHHGAEESLTSERDSGFLGWFSKLLLMAVWIFLQNYNLFREPGSWKPDLTQPRDMVTADGGWFVKKRRVVVRGRGRGGEVSSSEAEPVYLRHPIVCGGVKRSCCLFHD